MRAGWPINAVIGLIALLPLAAATPGCAATDPDGDGVAAGLDRCPDEAEDMDGHDDEDGCPDLDNDGDGILDTADGQNTDGFGVCRFAPEDLDGFQDDDGCPDPDNDGDGWLDTEDRCPLEPETANGYLDEDGCPDDASAPCRFAELAGSCMITSISREGSAVFSVSVERDGTPLELTDNPAHSTGVNEALSKIAKKAPCKLRYLASGPCEQQCTIEPFGRCGSATIETLASPVQP